MSQKRKVTKRMGSGTEQSSVSTDSANKIDTTPPHCPSPFAEPRRDDI